MDTQRHLNEMLIHYEDTHANTKSDNEMEKH